MSADQAEELTLFAGRLREVFASVHRGDERSAVRTLNALMRETGARPQLDRLSDGQDGWHVHFHGADDSLATGWAAGCATGLALAIGSDLAGRLGVCAAERCDRVFVDTSRNATRRFCSTACQSRTKAAAFRARLSGFTGSTSAGLDRLNQRGSRTLDQPARPAGWVR